MEKIFFLISNKYFLLFILLILLIFGILFFKKKIKNTRNIKKIIRYIYRAYFLLTIKIILSNTAISEANYFKGIFYVLLSFSIIKIVDIAIIELYYKNKKHRELPHLTRNILVFIIFSISCLLVLKNIFHINLASILTTSAILSVVIGLALQDTLTNFIAGLVLTSDNSFEIGDTVIADNMTGKVVDTNWRSTKISKAGGGIVRIPNNVIIKESTINYGKISDYLLIIKVKTAFSEPPNKIKEILLKIAKSNEQVQKTPTPVVIITDLLESTINYELRVFVKCEYVERLLIETELYTSIWYTFKREKIKIPYQIREILNPEDIKEVPDIIEKNYFKNVEFFKNLSDSDFLKISEIAKIVIFGKNEYIFSQGEEGDSFFVIKSGKVSVIIDDKPISSLYSGDFFGEMTLLTGKVRSASIKALEDTELLLINKESFKKIIQENNSLFDNVAEYLTRRELEYLTRRELENIEFEEKLSSSETDNGKQVIKNNTLKKLFEFFEI